MLRKIADYLTAIVVNMIFRSEFLILAVITFILHLLVHIPLYITFIILIVWVLYAAFITFFLTFVGGCRNIPKNQQGVSLHPGRNEHFDKMYKKDNP